MERLRERRDSQAALARWFGRYRNPEECPGTVWWGLAGAFSYPVKTAWSSGSG